MKKVIYGIIIILLIIGGAMFINKRDNVETLGDDKVKENSSVLEDDYENISSDDIIGRWDSVMALNSEDATETTNLRDVFGSSYSEYGSYMEFKDDGTFVDRIQPITNGSQADSGTYKIEKNYNKPGDCYVFLTYSDGRNSKLQKVILDDSDVSYLVLEEFVNGYQITLRKR